MVDFAHQYSSGKHQQNNDYLPAWWCWSSTRTYIIIYPAFLDQKIAHVPDFLKWENCSFWYFLQSIHRSWADPAGLFERRIDHGSGATGRWWLVNLVSEPLWVRFWSEKRMAKRLRSCNVLVILLVVYFSWVLMCIKVWESWEVWSIHLDMVPGSQDHWSPRFQQRGAVLRRLVTKRRLVGAVGCGSCLEPHRCPVSLLRKHQHLHFPEKGHFDYPLYQDSMLAPILEVVGRCSRDHHQCESGFSCLVAPNFYCMALFIFLIKEWCFHQLNQMQQLLV